MIKGLEALENICNQCEHYQFEKGLRPKKCPFNKNCVFRNRIEKELKALEIIRKKCSPLLKQYLLDLLPKEEYDLLKEVLL